MTDAKPQEETDSTSDSESEFEVEDEFPTTPPPGFADPTSYTQTQIDRLVVLMKGGGQAGSKTRVVPLGVCPTRFLKDLVLMTPGTPIRQSRHDDEGREGDGCCRRAGFDGGWIRVE